MKNDSRHSVTTSTGGKEMRRKIIELKIFINEEKGVFESTLNRKCNKYDAMNIIQQFVDRHRKGESIDGEPETSTQK